MPHPSALFSQPATGASLSALSCERALVLPLLGTTFVVGGFFLAGSSCQRAVVQYLQDASQGPSPVTGLIGAAPRGFDFEPADDLEGSGVATWSTAPAARTIPTMALCAFFIGITFLRKITLLNACQETVAIASEKTMPSLGP